MNAALPLVLALRIVTTSLFSRGLHPIRASRALWGATLAALLLAGCSTGTGYYTGDVVGGPDTTARADASRGGHDPLIDAPYRAETSCASEKPVTVLQRIKEVPFACADLGVSATIDEIRDAGWRIVSLDIGEDSESDNHVGFPVTIVVRKLF